MENKQENLKPEELKALMEYVNLGNSGLKVSRISYGNSNSWYKSDENLQERANRLVKMAWDCGITFFDTAETYYDGKGEELLGNALRSLGVPRSDFVVTSKLFWGKYSINTNSINNVGLSKKRIEEAVERSLKNFNFDYIDVYFCHRFDHETPTLEVVRAIKDLIERGKILYWAVSSWPPIRVMEAMLLCDQVNCPRPITEQPQYNLIERSSVEKDYLELIDGFGLGMMTWSPLKSGVLTGKYNNGIPEGSRLHKDTRNVNFGKYYDNYFDSFFNEEKKKETLRKLNGLNEIAESLGANMAQFSIAWILANKSVSSCIIGASKESQILENLQALRVVKKIDKEIEEKVNKLLDNQPAMPWNFKHMENWGPMPNRR